MSATPSLASGPQWTLPFGLDVSTNVFRAKFGHSTQTSGAIF